MKPTKWKSRIFLTLAGIILAVWVCALGFGMWSAFHAGKSSSQSVVSNYSSEELGVKFSYPKNYAFNFRHDSFQGTEIHVITMPDTMTVVPDMSEGPIAMSLIELPIAPSSLESWVRSNSISNFYLSPDKLVTPTTVGGQPALAYTYSGLYESDAVAVSANGKIYLFSASWIDANDPIRTDFKNLLSSVTFTK